MHRTRALLIASLFLAAAAQAATAPFHRTFNVAPGGTLTLDTDIGAVRVLTGSGGVTVDVSGRAALRDLDITVDQAGNDVNVLAKVPPSKKWFRWGGSDHVQFIVTVPSRYNLHLSTSGGDVEVGSIAGEVRARTSGGSVRVEGATGAADLRTSGGNVRIGAAGGSVQARTSGGSIEVHRVAGDLFARTSGGSITVDDALGAIDGETSGGSIRARFSRQPRSDSSLSTSGGSIRVALANNVALDLDAHTSGGDVDTDVPVTVMGKQSDSTVQGKINGGGPRLVLRSSGGGIHVTPM